MSKKEENTNVQVEQLKIQFASTGHHNSHVQAPDPRLVKATLEANKTTVLPLTLK